MYLKLKLLSLHFSVETNVRNSNGQGSKSGKIKRGQITAIDNFRGA